MIVVECVQAALHVKVPMEKCKSWERARIAKLKKAHLKIPQHLRIRVDRLHRFAFRATEVVDFNGKHGRNYLGTK